MGTWAPSTLVVSSPSEHLPGPCSQIPSPGAWLGLFLQPNAYLLACALDLGLSLQAARGLPPPLARPVLRPDAPALTNETEVKVSHLAGKSQC